MLFLDNIYNIPICISILDTHPLKPPMVYVKPTSTMQIKPSENVDCNGTVDLPFLQDWQYVRLTYFLFVGTFCSISYKNVTYPLSSHNINVNSWIGNLYAETNIGFLIDVFFFVSLCCLIQYINSWNPTSCILSCISYLYTLR